MAEDIDVVIHWLKNLRGEHLKHLQDVRLLFLPVSDEAQVWELRRTLLDLTETACDGSRGSDKRFRDRSFLQVEHAMTDELTRPDSQVQLIG